MQNAAIAKGVLDKDQQSLTVKQRDRFNQLVQSGIEPKIAKQLAIALTKSAGPDMTPPQGVRDAARRGLDQMGEHGGAGLTDGAKARARQMAAGNAVSASTARRMHSFHSRHGAQPGPMTDDKGRPTPKAVATNLWGGSAGAAWAKKLVGQLDKVEKGNKPLGAAFARAKRLQREKGGDEKDKRRRVNEYLRQAGHQPIGKGGPGSGPQGGSGKSAGTHLAAASMHLAAAKQARAKGNQAKAQEHISKAHEHSQKASAKLQAHLGSFVKKTYAGNFVEGARAALPSAYFNQLHTQARAKAGGKASGTARRAAKDTDKQALIAERSGVQARLNEIDDALRKSAPLKQEVGVDAPISSPVKLTAKQKKEREVLAARIAAQAMRATKSAQQKPELVNFAIPAKILKTSLPDYKRIVHSVVYAPGDVDAHGDYMSADDIEKMAHEAMKSGIYVNHEHAGPPLEVDIVESYIAPQDFDLELQDGKPYHIPKGSFIQAMHVWGDEPWSKVLNGEYVGYSLEGTALRETA